MKQDIFRNRNGTQSGESSKAYLGERGLHLALLTVQPGLDLQELG
jgi:hypothetical protein